MISKDNIDQRERKRAEGQDAAFYSSPIRLQEQSAQSVLGQVQAYGALG